MSKKHNTKHQRSTSRYTARLRRRGETSASALMLDYIGCGNGRTPTLEERLRVGIRPPRRSDAG